ncbi:acyl carrier protein [Streptomyces sp. Je 1-332]|uniref:acyl carrier protein n=1 Tax=Streptomyces sp. Je 1-332 TaxID=3231270 RepID=UPI00345B3CFF
MLEQTSPDYLLRLPDQQELRTAAADERIRMIEEYILQELRQSLDVPAAHRVSAQHPLRNQGVGSIMALRLKRMLELGLHVDVPAHLLLTNQSVTEIATGLAAQVEAALEQPARSGTPVCPEV